MAGYVIVNEELNKLNLNTDNLFGIMPIYNFIIDKYKQILLLILAVIIIYVVDYLTYYNTLFYGLTTSAPGTTQTNQSNSQHNQIKSNTFKKKHRKFKK